MTSTEIRSRFALDGDLAEATRQAVLAAGAFIRQEREDFTRDRAERKSGNDLVSYVDRTAEAMLTERFAELLPGCGFIAEESGVLHPEQEALWIVDPLDGTTNFVYGVPVFSVSVALQYQGRVILGYVYEVNRDELFAAGAGQGAFCNGKRIHVGEAEVLQDCLIATGFPFRREGKVDAYLGMLRDFMTSTRGVRRLGSAAIDLAYTAMGRFDGFFEAQLYPWDVAAGGLLVQEAGGTVTDFAGGTDFMATRSIVAANAAIHGIMHGIIGSYA